MKSKHSKYIQSLAIDAFMLEGTKRPVPAVGWAVDAPLQCSQREGQNQGSKSQIFL